MNEKNKNAVSESEKNHFLGLSLNNITMSQALHRIYKLIKNSQSEKIFFLNTHCMNVACHDLEYRGVLKSAVLT